MKQTKSTKTVANKMMVKKVVLKQFRNKKFGTIKVVRTEDGEGYACLDDLCGILYLPKKLVKEKLDGHLYTVSPKEAKGEICDMDFVDEFGIYVMYIMSKEKNALRVQEWLDEEFLEPLREQAKAHLGLNRNDKLAVEPDLQLQVLRYTATASNVIKSGHFKKGRAIPELTQLHLIGWWHNLNDQSIFMLQFNCKSDSCLYGNIRMNVYLRKMVDGRIDFCDMHISFLDLDDDNHEFLVIDTIMPSSVISDGTILDYIMEDQFMDEDILGSENLDLVMILNGTMSFHRSRRMEKKGQSLIEFL